MSSEALGRRLTVVIIAVLCISVVVFAAVYGQPTTDKGLGGGCDWDPDTWEVVCEPTATPTPTPVPPTEVPTRQTVPPTATFTSVPTRQTVPPTATFTSVPTATWTSTPSPTYTPTAVPILPTRTFTPTPTPTPRPTPTGPTGWIKALPAKIVVGQTTTITAGWSNVGQDPSIVPSSTSLATSCSGVRGKSIIGPQQTQVMAGCSGGTVAVTLRHSETNKILATVTVTVLDRPVIERYEEMAYRWFHIYWRGPADYTSYRVDWYDTDTSRWKPLSNAVSGPRAILYTASAGASTRAPQPSPLPGTPTHADVRGVEYNSQTKVRVVGSTFDNVSGTSAEFTVRLTRPDALGHLGDHTVVYDLNPLSRSDETELANWIRDVAALAANGWANLISSLRACEGSCAGNDDTDIVRVRINEHSCQGSEVIACVEKIPPRIVDTVFDDNRYMTFTPNPESGAITYYWTDLQARHGHPVNGDNTQVFLWIGAVALHEFGHVYGIKDRYETDLTYSGIMNTHYLLDEGVATIGTSDVLALNAIYKGNRPNLGW